MSKILGLSEGFHDAGATLIQDGNILSATHAERISRVKNDRWLHYTQIDDADTTAFYEKDWLKRTRQIYAGQPYAKPRIKTDVSFYHHQSHAAAGFYTSKFDECNILVVDAIGEWDTVSVWKGWTKNDKPQMKKIKSFKYPYSIGLFYSAITKYLGLRPMEDEYITMGMAAFGFPTETLLMENILENVNCHKGLPDIPELRYISKENLASSAQSVVEAKLTNLVLKHCPSRNLVMMCGVALN